MAASPSLAWSGPCDVVVRRHPKGGYLFSISGSGTHALHAHGFYGMARFYAKESSSAPTDELGAEAPLTHEQASKTVEAMRAFNVLVDDKVLKIDQRMKQWGAILPSVIVFGGLAAFFFTEGQGGFWTIASTALIFIAGLLVGGTLCHQFEQDGTSMPTPLQGALFIVMPILGFGGLFAYVGGVVWTYKKLGGWGLVLFTVGYIVLMILVGVLIDKLRAPKLQASASAPNKS